MSTVLEKTAIGASIFGLIAGIAVYAGYELSKKSKPDTKQGSTEIGTTLITTKSPNLDASLAAIGPGASNSGSTSLATPQGADTRPLSTIVVDQGNGMATVITKTGPNIQANSKEQAVQQIKENSTPTVTYTDKYNNKVTVPVAKPSTQQEAQATAAEEVAAKPTFLAGYEFQSTGFAGGLQGPKTTQTVVPGIGQFTRNSAQEAIVKSAEAARGLVISYDLGYLDKTGNLADRKSVV